MCQPVKASRRRGDIWTLRRQWHSVQLAWVALFACCTITLADAADLAEPRINATAIAAAGGAHGTPACASCHGANGEGNALIGFPRLAGLSRRYLSQQLTNFASNKRANAMMTPIAQTLTPEELVAIADFYAGLSPHAQTPSPGPTASSSAATPLGETLAERGRWSDDLPACAQCHGRSGQGVGDPFPALAAQPALYLENQLRAWQSGARDPGPQGLMGAIARKLSAADVTDVATYFSSLPLRAGDSAP